MLQLLAITSMHCVEMNMTWCYTHPEKEDEMFCFVLNILERLVLSFSLNIQ